MVKKIKWIAIIIIGITLNAYAQTGNTAVGQAKQLQLALKLTDQQTTRLTTVIQQINTEQTNDKAAQANLKNWQATHNTKAIINYILKQMDANASRIEQVLTTEQKKTFRAMLGKRRDGLKKLAAAQN